MKFARGGIALLIVPLAALHPQTATVTRNTNLRPTSSSSQPAIRLLVPPEKLVLLDPAPTTNYYHVRTQEQDTGWVYSHNIAIDTGVVTGTGSVNDEGPAIPPAGTFASDLASCPAVGTHMVGGAPTPYADTSDAGLRNMAKRHIPVGATPLTLDLAAFLALQDGINSRFVDANTAKTQFHPDRHALMHLAVPGGTVSEGDLVQIATRVTAVHNEKQESVNCAGADGHDIHINVGAPDGTEWHGVVVEMIPQLGRPAGWDSATIAKVAAAHLPVLVVGGLTYDNEHLLNADSTQPRAGQPKRASLWEIHPITAFYVCDATTCDPANRASWTSLTAWAKAHAP
ncbi:MAG: hypothetical protein ACREK8_11230 [Gemmatimonadales bacterium]